MSEKPATPQDVEKKLDDFRDVQDIIDKAVAKKVEQTNATYRGEIKSLYDLVFETNKSVKDLSEKVAPIVVAWGEGKTTTKILWIILKGIAWTSSLVIAIGGAVIVIKEALKR